MKTCENKISLVKSTFLGGRPTPIQWLADGGEAGLRISILSQLIFWLFPPMSPKHDIVGYIYIYKSQILFHDPLPIEW